MPPERTTRDVAVHWLDDGDHVWVGLHGWNGSWRTFQPLVGRLDDDQGVMGIDLPGYGDSPAPETFDLAHIGRSVAETIRREVRLPCSLIGSCSGGVIGLFVADALGDELEHFVFLEPFAYVPWYLRLLLVPLAGRLFYRLAFGTSVGRGIADAAMAETDEDTAMMESFADTDLAVPYGYLAAFDRLSDANTFGDLPGRKHLLYAEQTFGAVRRSVERWEGVWPDATVREVPDAGHLLLEDAPAHLAEYLSGLFTPSS